MLSLKCRSRLIFGGILLIFLLVLAIVNANAFLIDGVLSIKNILSFASVTSIAVILLLFDIKLPDKVKNIVSWVIFALGPVICFEMVRVVVNAPKYQDHIYFENLIFYALVQLLVFAITQSSRISLVVSFTLSYCLHLANQLVLLLRGTPLVPTDLYAAGTALTVTNPSEWHFDFPLLLGTASFLACIGLALACKITFKKVLKRIACGAVALIMAVSAGIYIWNLDYKSYSTSTFDTESTNRVNGVMLSFYINARKMKIDPPVGYSEQALNEALSKYTESELNIADFSYSGPRPTSKIAAIIMICDASEAAVRSQKGERDANKVNDIVKKIIQERMDADQFINCPITMKDLNLIQVTIAQSLSGVYHHRVTYPKVKFGRRSKENNNGKKEGKN